MTGRLTIITFLIIFFVVPTRASALTVEQFAEICDSVPGECSDHPVLQAYVGGALDLLATLTEETGKLEAFFCKAPERLFDVPAIIRFIQTHGEGYENRNAMLLMVQYFEENGECQPGE
ncbi:hypothetical protein [Emcibacter sp.]|uniref:hypothetical protein n=1 Tax=Emcibacter sp. TaxID=1979954 RepID=UPI003A91EB5D